MSQTPLKSRQNNQKQPPASTEAGGATDRSTPVGKERQERPWLSIPVDWRRPQHTKGYQLLWSDRDRFGQLWPRPTSAEIASSYDLAEYYTHQRDPIQTERPLSAGLARWLVRIAWRFDHSVLVDPAWVRSVTGENRSLEILDIGAGNGRLLQQLAAAGHTVCGVEPDEAARQVALAAGSRVFPGTAERLPQQVSGRQYDLIFMLHVLEHVLDVDTALKNLHALLRPGGRLVIEVPNNAALGLSLAGPVWRWLDVPRHLNFFTPDSLSRALVTAGLNPEKVEYRGYTRQFKPEWLKDEQEIWHHFAQTSPSFKAQYRQMPSLQRQVRLLLRTLPASPDKKYDSVRIISRRE